MSVMPSQIKTRRDLLGYMHDVMASSTQQWRRERRHKAGEGRLKAYLLDAHIGNGDPQEQVLALLHRVCALDEQATVTETEDARLFGIALGEESLFVDAADPRFMIVHTAGRAENTDRFIVGAVDAMPELDRAWLPSWFLLRSANDIGRCGVAQCASTAASYWAAPDHPEAAPRNLRPTLMI